MSKIIYTEVYNPNGNFLFTVDELNSAKTNDKCLKARCLYCGKIFYITRKEYIAFYNRVYKGKSNGSTRTFKHCSDKCMRLEKHELSKCLFETTCSHCGAPITKNIHLVNNKQQRFFCNSSCAATYNNLHRDQLFDDNDIQTIKEYIQRRLKDVPQNVEDMTKEEYFRACRFKFGFELTNIQGHELLKQYGAYSSKSNLDGVARDHIFSILQGWMFKIPPHMISHPANCRIIRQSDNVRKSSKSMITIEQLEDRIRLWEHGLPLPVIDEDLNLV